MNIELLDRLRRAGGDFLVDGVLGDDPARLVAELDELVAFGFSLERHPFRGTAYRGAAERLCPDQIEWGWQPRHIGRRIAVWDRVASTNDLAAKAAASIANDGLVILAESQTAGRGRRGRTWTVPPRTAVLMSVLIFPSATLSDPSWLTALGAVAVAQAVSTLTGLDARIKWPNDVRVGGRKIAGILVERGAKPGVVVGIGLNVNLDLSEFPEELRDSAASLSHLMGEPVDRSELARSLIARLDHLYGEGLDRGIGPLAKPWRDLNEHLGGHVEISHRDGVDRGTLIDLALGRSLTFRLDDGRTIEIPEGAITSIRATDERVMHAEPSPG